MKGWERLLLLLPLASCGEAGGRVPTADAGDVWETSDADDGSGSAPACPDGTDAVPCTPALPRGVAACDCPSDVVEGSGMFEGGGVCVAELPRLADWECALGWEPVPLFVDAIGLEDPPPGLEQRMRCEPVVATGCEGVSVAQIGAEECVPFHAECPPDDATWPADSVLRERAPRHDGAILFVATTGEADGDGSREAPFASVQEALAVAADGDILALGAGSWSEAISIEAPVALVGACAERTVLAPADGRLTATIQIGGAGGAHVSDVTLTGERPGLSVVGTTEPVSVERVLVTGALSIGIQVQYGAQAVQLSDLAVRGTRPRADGTWGVGLLVEDGSAVALERVELSGNSTTALYVQDEGSEVDATGVVIRDTEMQPQSGRFGYGIALTTGAKLTGRSVLIERSTGTGIAIASGGGDAFVATTATLSDLVVRATRSLGRLGGGRGISVEGGSQVILERFVLSGNAEAAMATLSGSTPEGEAPTRLEARDGLISDTTAAVERGLIGRGAGIVGGSSVSLERVVIRRSIQTNLLVSGEDWRGPPDVTRLVATDLVLTGSRPGRETDSGGQGITVQNGAVMEATRVLVDDSVGDGVFVGTGALVENAPPVSARFTDLTVTNTVVSEETETGDGLSLYSGGLVELTRARFIDVPTTAIWIDGFLLVGEPLESRAILRDIVIARTTLPAPGEDGLGITLINGAQAELERVWITGASGFGVYATSQGAPAFVAPTALVARDIAIRAVVPAEAAMGGGAGVAVGSGAQATLDRVRISETRGHGLVAFGAYRQPGRPETNLVLNDATIDGIESRDTDFSLGRGIEIGGDVTAGLTRISVRATRDEGILVIGSDTPEETDGMPEAILRDVLVSGTRVRGCAELPPQSPLACAGMGFGSGFVVAHAGRVELERFVVDSSAFVGVQLVDAEDVQFRRGEISDNAIGINLQEGALDLSTAFVEVRLSGNGVDIETELLAVPDAGEVLATEP